MSDLNEEIRLAVLRGRVDERERIIKLLDSLVQVTSADLTEQVSKNDALCEAIELIKGETWKD